MILVRASMCFLAVSAALVASNAKADVMELDANGARWVAGGQSVLVGNAVPPATNPNVQNATAQVPESVEVPTAAIANTAANAAGVPARYAAKIQELAERYDLSPSLLEAVVWQESRWREKCGVSCWRARSGAINAQHCALSGRQS